MNKIKRFVNCSVPINTCNLRCKYCYITQAGQFNSKIEKFQHSPQYIAKALSVKRLGGTCFINLCGGGETLLAPEIIELTKLLLEDGHFVGIVTNGTVTKRIDEICNIPRNLLEQLFIKFSFHYLELKRLNLIDTYFENIKKIKDSGSSFSVEMIVDDEIIPYIDEIKNICMEKLGTLCHVMESRNHVHKQVPRLTKMPLEEHQKTWESFESTLFNYQQTTWGIKRNEFCYAGEWTLHVHLDSGKFFQCFNGQVLQNIYDNVDEPIRFCAIGKNCPWPHCYTSYAWIALGSTIPSLEAPYYSELRNRTCLDGSEWLTPKMKAFFSSKPSESNERYGEEKELLVNSFMAYLYGHGEILDKEKAIKILEEKLINKGYTEIAIYGMGKGGNWLFNILRDSKIKVKYTIDRNNNNLQLPIKCVSPDDISQDIDAIIVTPLAEFTAIRKHIENHYCGDIISILDLVD